jgi:hypothetical protein
VNHDYNDHLLVTHGDHLVPYQYDERFLYDPVHHYIFDKPVEAKAPAVSPQTM